MGLGPVELVSLAEARDAALAARKLVLSGIDPIEHRKAAKAALVAAKPVFTFRQVAERYIAAHERAWKNEKHRHQWGATLKSFCYPVFGEKPVDQIDIGLVMRVLDGLWHEKPETATRVRGRIESILDYAKARGWRYGENPARWKGHLENLLPKRSKLAQVKHHAALPWPEMGTFMETVRAAASVTGWALEFTILTAARTSETLGAVWSEIDLAARCWTVPGRRMKAGQEHRVPLTDRAIEILEAVAPLRTSGASFVFPGAKAGKGLSQMALVMALRRLGHGDMTVHGFRSTFRDWAAESTNYPREVAEAALAHTLRDRVEAAYRRSDLFEKRRQLMEEWDRFCDRPAVPQGAVMPMRAAS